MMKTKNQTLRTVVAVVLCGIFANTLMANNVVKENRELNNVSKLSVDNGIVVNLTQGSQEELFVMAPENMLTNVVTEQTNNVLKISYTGSTTNTPQIFVYITVKNLDFIQASGNTKIISYQPLDFSTVQLFCNGNSEMEFNLVSENVKGVVNSASQVTIKGLVDAIDLNATGQSKIWASVKSETIVGKVAAKSSLRLEGKTKSIEVKAHDNSTITASQLKSKRCNIDASDDSNVIACSNRSVNLTAKNRSEITISGAPANKTVLASDDSNITFQ